LADLVVDESCFFLRVGGYRAASAFFNN
jgi:hypothetical protein